MTPIKLFLIVGTSVYTVDHAGEARLISVSPSRLDAEWVANGLAAYHGKPVEGYGSDSLPSRRLLEV